MTSTVRLVAAMILLVAGMCLAIVGHLAGQATVSVLGTVLVGAASIWLVGALMLDEFRRDLDVAGGRTGLAVVAALACLVGLIVCVGWLVADTLGAMLAGAAVILAEVSFYRNAARYVLHLAGAYPISGDGAHDLQRLADRLAAQAGAPGTAVQLYWLPGNAPNALAAGRDLAHAAIALTPDLPTLLDHDELAGLLAREIACLARADTWAKDMTSALAGGLMWMSRWTHRSWRAAESADGNSTDWAHRIAARAGTILHAPLVRIAARVLRAAGSAECVHSTDAAGAQLLSDPLPLARALAKLAAANSARPDYEANPGLAQQFAVMPYTEEALQPLFSTLPPWSARLERLTREALRPYAPG